MHTPVAVFVSTSTKGLHLAFSLIDDIVRRFGSFLRGVELFDSAAFGASQSEALLIDPQQRLLLEAMTAIGLQNSSASGLGRCGVYVGMSSIDYARLTALYSPEATAYSATGTYVLDKPLS